MDRYPTNMNLETRLLRVLDELARREKVSRSEMVNRVVEDSPRVREFLSGAVVGGLGLGFLGMLYLVAWAVCSVPVAG